MKKIFSTFAALGLAIAAGAQTLNIQVGNVTWQFPSSQTGEMTWSDGTSLTVMGKTFSVSDITSVTVDESSVTDATVGVVYNGETAAVTVAGNVAQYLTVTQSGAHVSIAQSDDLAEEITYTLSGTSADGEFYMSGSYKATVEFDGLTLTNATPVYSGAAVHIQNGKRIKVKPLTGTTSTLTDAASGSQKGCLYIKGHAEFAQKGTLNIVGNVKHGIKAGVKTQSGKTYTYSGGMVINGGTVSVTTSGRNAEGIESKNTLEINGGYIYVNAYDDAVNAGQNLTVNDGYIMAISTNNDGMDANGNMYIKGGNIVAVSSKSPEVALDANTEEQKQLYITGGNVVAIGGLERGASVSNGTARQASSYNKGTWYGLYNSSSSLAFAFKVPSNSSMGTPMVVYTTGTTSLKSGVTGSGTAFWSGNGYTSCSGGSTVSLSTYSSNSGGGGGGFGPR